jgi:hypothetical protein
LTQDQSGEFEAQSGEVRLRLAKVAPGVFFTMFGSCVLIAALLQHPEYQANFKGNPDHQNPAPPSPMEEVHIAARGLADAGSGVDPASCAQAVNYAIDKLTTVSGAAIGNADERDERVSQLNLVLMQCVDNATRKGDFAKYRKVSKAVTEGETSNVSKDDRDAYSRVSNILSR